MHLRREEITAARLLRGAGYATAHVGKWHLNGEFNSPKQPQPNDHGFDWWFATQNNASPSHANPRNFVRNGRPVGPLPGYSADLIVEEAITWLKTSRAADQPFYLNVWFHEPHKPIATAPELIALYGGTDAQTEYRANVTQLDRASGRLLQALDDLKLAENTLVIFTSDNGPEGRGKTGYGQTGGLRGRKRDTYEGGIRVPGILRWPGRIPAGVVNDAPVIGSDIFPTVCEVAGVAAPGDRVIDGTSLVPLFGGAALQRNIPLYWRRDLAVGPTVAMRKDEWKILADEQLTRFELYNLREDPRETTDLATREPARLAVLRETLSRLKADIESESSGIAPVTTKPGKKQRRRAADKE